MYRNRQVQSPYDKVLSSKHTRRWIAQKATLIGIKMAGADIDPRDLGPDIKLTPGGADERDNNVNLLTARAIARASCPRASCSTMPSASGPRT